MQQSPSFTFKRTDYLIVVLAILVSGNMAFSFDERQEIFLVVSFFISICFFFSRKIQIFKVKDLVVFFLFLAILIIQGISFNYFPLETLLGFFLKLFVGYSAYRLVDHFPIVYIRSMISIGVLSLLFYIPDQISYYFNLGFREHFKPIKDFIGIETRFNIIFHNFQLDHNYFRNSGFFWEPGALAGYLLLAIIFLGLYKDRIESRTYFRQLFFLTILLSTTFSTTGYVVYPFALLLHFTPTPEKKSEISRRFLAFYISIIALTVVAYFISDLDFITGKITNLIQRAINREHNWELSRFGSLIFDWAYIKERPLFGWGLSNTTRYMLHPYLDEFRMGNGFSDFLARFGLIGLAIFVYRTGKGLKRLTNSRPLVLLSTVTILAILNGETFLNYPIFLGLMFLDPAPPSRPMLN